MLLLVLGFPACTVFVCLFVVVVVVDFIQLPSYNSYLLLFLYSVCDGLNGREKRRRKQTKNTTKIRKVLYKVLSLNQFITLFTVELFSKLVQY